MRKVFVAGGVNTPFIGKFHPDFIWKKHPDFGVKENPDTEEYLRRITKDTVELCGVDGTQIDRAYVGNFVGELFDNQGHLGALLVAALPGLAGKPVARLEGACASGGLALGAAVDAIRAGADVVLVAGVEVQNTRNAKDGADFLARASHYKRQRPIDPFTFPALFARRNRAVVGETETTLDDLALASVKAYGNANRNPLAHMHAVQMSFENASTVSGSNPNFLANPELNPWMRISDCSQVSDGASAMIVASEAGLERIGRAKADCVELLSCAIATASIAEDTNPLVLENVAGAARMAMASAGIQASDIDLAEVHDCFTVVEILMYEALGLAAPGKGARLLREGETSIGGRIPVNTGGGLVGFGHPVGASGVKQIIELWRQSKGLCGDYQMDTTPNLSIAASMGGDDRTAVVSVCRNIH